MRGLSAGLRRGGFWPLVMSLVLVLLTAGAGLAAAREAAIEVDNSQLIALMPFSLRVPSTDYHPTYDTTLAISDGKTVFGFLEPIRALQESFMQILASVNAPASCADRGDLDGISGPPEEFSGRLQLRDFSPDCRWRLTGKVRVKRSKAGKKSPPIQIEWEQVQMKLKDRQIGVSGEMDLAPAAGEMQKSTFSLQLQLEDGRVFVLDDLELSLQHEELNDRLTLAGGLHHPRFGSVRIETDSPLLFDPGDARPYDGALFFRGRTSNWVRIYFPVAAKPGFYMVDTKTGQESMGNL